MKTFGQLTETLTITGGRKAYVERKPVLHADNSGPFGGQPFDSMTKEEHERASKYHNAEMKKLRYTDDGYDKHYKFKVAHKRAAEGDFSEKGLIHILGHHLEESTFQKGSKEHMRDLVSTYVDAERDYRDGFATNGPFHSDTKRLNDKAKNTKDMLYHRFRNVLPHEDDLDGHIPDPDAFVKKHYK
jgi:hypothetical protein